MLRSIKSENEDSLLHVSKDDLHDTLYVDRNANDDDKIIFAKRNFTQSRGFVFSVSRPTPEADRQRLQAERPVERPVEQLYDVQARAGMAQVGQYNVANHVFKVQRHFQAGSIGRNIQTWKTLTNDRILLSHIKAHRIEWLREPVQVLPARQIRFTIEEIEFLQEEIALLEQKGVVQKVEHVQGEFISNVFLRPKKEEGKYRMILNLKKLNENVEYHHFKMETFETALHLIHMGDYMTSLDFSDAYYSLAISEKDRKFLRFQLGEQLYEFTCLPNGLSSGPRIFTKILKVPLTWLRQNYGIIITGYIDDTLLVADSAEKLAKQTVIAADLFHELGFVISEKKSVVQPTQKLQFLGFVIDTESGVITLPLEKSSNLRNAIRNLLNSRSVSLRQFAKVLGSLVATSPANTYLKVHTKLLDIFKTDKLKQLGYDYEAIIYLPREIREELEWWEMHIQNVQAPLHVSDPNIVIYTDASNLGWGGFMPQSEQTCQGRWTEEEALDHINVLELRAVFYVLKALCSGHSDIHVRIMTDNTTAMSCINKQGSTHSLDCNRITRQIWLWAEERQIYISAAHVPGSENIEADNASRKFQDELEWMVSDEVFQKICEVYDTPQIDLFATYLNYKVKPFCAWKPDPEATVIDSFTVSWTDRFGYAFPPFSLIGPVLHKVRRDQAKIIIIVPNWPSRSWYPILADMLLASPRFFEMENNNLFLPSRPTVSHALAGKARLLACLVSGKLYNAEDTQIQWSGPCYQRDESHQGNFTTPTSSSGMFIVLRGVSILIIPLLRKD